MYHLPLPHFKWPYKSCKALLPCCCNSYESAELCERRKDRLVSENWASSELISTTGGLLKWNLVLDQQKKSESNVAPSLSCPLCGLLWSPPLYLHSSQPSSPLPFGNRSFCWHVEWILLAFGSSAPGMPVCVLRKLPGRSVWQVDLVFSMALWECAACSCFCPSHCIGTQQLKRSPRPLSDSTQWSVLAQY